ncbi:hypothetical protein [Prosthecobacter sp.]|uniref:hypothetical protein n=1 Tax=Prosthecobacter sp. TaxID=1965333 RepID=UPI001DA55CD9|nr:hypothetical protein [Prosthecobacter sp.]MCB1275411.1 hypothetical protein [Prosthecobacter sp.]
MRHLLIASFLLLPVCLNAQVIEVSPPRQPHTIDATVGYEMTSKEETFHAKKPDMGGDNGFGAKKAGTLLGFKGKLVSWFGIVREIPEGGKGTFLIENKYYDGLNDAHMQLASLYGAGDFRVEAVDSKKQIKHHCLVRVIGDVTGEKEGAPVVKAQYIRVWNLGDFAFMDYGVDASNERWVRLRQKVNLVYSPSPDAAYYEKLLGK